MDQGQLLGRIADGLVGVLMSLRANAPQIRYDEGSHICQAVA